MCDTFRSVTFVVRPWGHAGLAGAPCFVSRRRFTSSSWAGGWWCFRTAPPRSRHTSAGTPSTSSWRTSSSPLASCTAGRLSSPAGWTADTSWPVPDHSPPATAPMAFSEGSVLSAPWRGGATRTTGWNPIFRRHRSATCPSARKRSAGPSACRSVRFWPFLMGRTPPGCWKTVHGTQPPQLIGFLFQGGSATGCRGSPPN